MTARNKNRNLECWYFTGHFQGQVMNLSNRPIHNLSIFICFSCINKQGYGVQILLFDKTRKIKYYNHVFDKLFVKLGYNKILKQKTEKSYFEKQYHDFVEKGIIPKPDILAINDTIHSNDNDVPFIKIDENILKQDKNGNYIVMINTNLYKSVSTDMPHIDILRCNLIFDTQNWKISGNININNLDEIQIVNKNDINNKAWYDHHNNNYIDNQYKMLMWLQLNNNMKIYFNSKNELILIDDNNNINNIKKYDIINDEKEEELFVSNKTFIKYKTEYSLNISVDNDKYKKIKLDIKCTFNKLINCEIIDASQSKICWISPVDVVAIIDDKIKINGRGFYKMISNHDLFDTFNELQALQNISKFLSNTAIHSIYPKFNDLNQKHLLKLMTLNGFITNELNIDNYNDLDIKLLHKNLLKPTIELIKQRGKGWRSFGCIISGNIVSFSRWNPTQTFLKQLIALQELSHVGSLIIDDIQDNSLMRRGQKCVHIKYDINTAINAGNAV